MAEDWARPVVHWEIQALDAEKQANFYRELANWEIGEGRIMQIGAGIGAPEPITGHIRSSDAARVSLYIQVLKIRESMQKAVQMGGSIVREPFDPTPGGATLAWIDDPEGNRVVLVQQ